MGKPLVVHADADMPLEKTGFEKDQIARLQIPLRHFLPDLQLALYGSRESEVVVIDEKTIRESRAVDSLAGRSSELVRGASPRGVEYEEVVGDLLFLQPGGLIVRRVGQYRFGAALKEEQDGQQNRAARYVCFEGLIHDVSCRLRAVPQTRNMVKF